MNGASPFVLSTAGLLVAYVTVAIVLLGMNVWARQRWWGKFGTILGVGGFFFVSFYSVIGILGWPVNQRLPDEFEVVSAMIMDPVPEMQFPGAIYLWVTAVEDNRKQVEAVMFNPDAVGRGEVTSQVPRAYRIPYSTAAERQIVEAQIKQVEGVREIGTANRRPMKPGEHAPQTEFFFHERPDPVLPPKTGGEAPKR